MTVISLTPERTPLPSRSVNCSVAFVAGVPAWKPVPERPENPAATQTVGAIGVSMPTRPTKSLAAFGSRSGKAFSPIGSPFMNGERVAREAPAALQADADVVLAGEEAALRRRALEEQALAIALPDLEAERDLEEADGRHEQRQGAAPLGRKLQRRLGADDARLRPVDGVAVELDEAGHPPTIDRGAQARAADVDLVQVERLSRRIELILRRLVVDHPVGLQISSQADAEARGEHFGGHFGRLGPCGHELGIQRVDRLGSHLPVLDLLVAQLLEIGPQLRDLARLLLLQGLARLLARGGSFSGGLGRGVVRRRLWSERRGNVRPFWWAAPSGAPRPFGPRLSSTPRTHNKRPNTVPI